MSRMQKTVASVINICIIGITVEAFYHIMVCQICICHWIITKLHFLSLYLQQWNGLINVLFLFF